MNIAFALYKYFPYGGLQRDMLRIARVCVEQGAAVTVYCAQWDGDFPDNILVKKIAVKGISNHRRNEDFSQHFQRVLQEKKHDLVVGFNKMPGLDFYYAADTCFKAKLMQERWPLLRFLPRYRRYLQDEESVFGPGSKTRVLAIAARSVGEYEKYYPGCSYRCAVLPPGINVDRRAPDNAAEIRKSFRDAWSIKESDRLVLMIGSGFRTKGLDRAIHALAALPVAWREKAQLIVIGQDKKEAFAKLARKLGVEKRLQFLSGRNDIPDFLQGADVLIHPAYRENTGTVLLEAAVAGLPVLTTAVCGYSSYIREYACGIVIDEPFSQKQLNEALLQMLQRDDERKNWRRNGLAMAEQADIYSLFDRAAELIIAAAREKQS